jgi:hypothetical protein
MRLRGRPAMPIPAGSVVAGDREGAKEAMSVIVALRRTTS